MNQKLNADDVRNAFMKVLEIQAQSSKTIMDCMKEQLAKCHERINELEIRVNREGEIVGQCLLDMTVKPEAGSIDCPPAA